MDWAAAGSGSVDGPLFTQIDASNGLEFSTARLRRTHTHRPAAFAPAGRLPPRGAKGIMHAIG